MMAEIRKAMKLLWYGYGVKSNMAVAFICIIMGIVLFCLGEVGAVSAVLLTIAAPTVLFQFSYTLLCCGIASSSTQRRLLEIVLPDFLSIIIGIAAYSMAVIVTGIWMVKKPENSEVYMAMLLNSSVVIAIILILTAWMYKFFWATFVSGFLGGVIAFIHSEVVEEIISIFSGKITIWSAAFWGMLSVLAGVMISCLVRRLLYKRPVSLRACGASFRKAMQ